MITDQTPISLKLVLAVLAAGISWGFVYTTVINTQEQVARLEIKVDTMSDQIATLSAQLSTNDLSYR